MQPILQQLAGVRTRARALLVAQRLCQALVLLLGAALLLGLLDFALRLPVWVRVAVLVLVVGLLVLWLSARLVRAMRFWPSLGEIALRAERLHPSLAGTLASAVEFSLAGDELARVERTAMLSDASIERARRDAGALRFSDLINPTSAVRAGVLAAAILAVFASVVVAAPVASRTAAERWLTPWTGVDWPRRTEIQTLTTENVWPTDAPLRLRAQVARGYRPGMRVWVHYRVVDGDQSAAWQSLLMNEQAATQDGADGAAFERLIDLPESVLGSAAEAHVEFAFEAGDARTDPQSLALVARPSVLAVQARVSPPAYAAGLVSEQRAALHQQPSAVATASALTGSQVTFKIALNKPLDEQHVAAAGLPASLRATGTPPPTNFAAEFPLRETVETTLRLVDEHGLTNLSERRYRIEAVADQPPAASLLSPSGDESVLPTAQVQVEGLAQDDVAVEQIALLAQVNEAEASTLAERSGRQPSLTVEHALDLTSLEVAPGNVVTLTAATRDVYELDGQRHDVVQSSPRRLRVIDAATLISQLRAELAGVRQQAIRLDQDQAQTAEREPADAGPQQARLTSRLQSQRDLVNRLDERAQRNRLDEPTVSELLRQAGGLIEQARAASEAAANQLRQEQDAPQQQQAVRQSLRELIDLLDQGQDALALQLQLGQLRAQLQALEQDTRALLPRTLGQPLDQLSPELREALQNLAQRQAALRQQAQELVRQMHSTAQALARAEDDDAAQAAAEALAEAAGIAQREGLDQQLESSAQALGENQLAQAGQQQNQAMEVLQQMLSELGQQQERRLALLQRRLQELAQLIQQLIERQQAQLDRLAVAENLTALEQPLTQLRVTTMGVQQRAAANEQTAAVAEPLDAAVGAQADAVLALREANQQGAQQAEEAALEHLNEALAVVEQQAAEAQQAAAKQQREELREAYRALAAQQSDLRGRAADIAGAGQLDRRQRAAAVALGHEQTDLRLAAHDLAAQVGEALLFEHLHGLIDAAAERASTQLRRAALHERVLADQAAVAGWLTMLADALEQDESENDFAGEQPGGGGGGGGAGGAAAQAVPDLAQLKVLRLLQQSVYERTRSLGGAAGPTMDQDLVDLAAQQRELAALGQALIEQLQQKEVEAAIPEEAGE